MNVIDKYEQAKSELFTHFKYDSADYGVENSTTYYWKIDGRGIGWSDEPWNEDSEPEYSEEIRGIYRADDLTMISIYSCTGDKYLAVFDNTKEIKE